MVMETLSTFFFCFCNSSAIFLSVEIKMFVTLKTNQKRNNVHVEKSLAPRAVRTSLGANSSCWNYTFTCDGSFKTLVKWFSPLLASAKLEGFQALFTSLPSHLYEIQTRTLQNLNYPQILKRGKRLSQWSPLYVHILYICLNLSLLVARFKQRNYHLNVNLVVY